jgi:acyl-coenzyme A thioesterase PaaI-like protein
LDPLFQREGERYLPQDCTGAGWTAPMLHGGPVAALLAHAIERERRDPALLPARLTVDLLRPVRQAPLSVRTSVTRDGKRIKLVDAFVLDGDTVVARASGLLLRRDVGRAQAQTLGARAAIPRWQDAPQRHWAKTEEPDPTVFHQAVEVRRITEWHRGEPLVAWVRIPFTMLPDRPLTPFERAATLADFANSMGMMSQQGFPRAYINADLTLTLVRELEGEWTCLEIAARADRDGVAISLANYHDERGFAGHAVVSCLDNALPERVQRVADATPG